MKIERAVMDDVVAVVALERETEHAPHWPEGEYRAAALGGDANLRRCLLVARRGGELAGFAAGTMVAGVAEIESVAVRASSRRCGVGRALCEAVIAWADGAEAVELEVRAGSAGARALYAGLGFVDCGRRAGYYRDPVDDAVLMRLDRVETALVSAPQFMTRP